LIKFALVSSVAALLVLATLAHAQQIDIAVGASTLLSSRETNASLGFQNAAEKGGVYPSFSFDRIFENRLGFGGEVAVRAKEGLYNGYQEYRPVLYDLNAIFAPRLGKKANASLMAGIGGQSALFYSASGACGFPGGCASHVNSTHLLVHVGGGIRYPVWRHFFIFPEAHYYRIVNNTDDFHSNNVYRVGASIGYTIGR
jgi:hypothetical protein